jgi:hypothetical protein
MTAMAISIVCEVCRRQLQVAESMRGQIADCPHCGDLVTVPAAGPPPPPAATLPSGELAVLQAIDRRLKEIERNTRHVRAYTGWLLGLAILAALAAFILTVTEPQ